MPSPGAQKTQFRLWMLISKIQHQDIATSQKSSITMTRRASLDHFCQAKIIAMFHPKLGIMKNMQIIINCEYFPKTTLAQKSSKTRETQILHMWGNFLLMFRKKFRKSDEVNSQWILISMQLMPKKNHGTQMTHMISKKGKTINFNSLILIKPTALLMKISKNSWLLDL